MGHSLLAPDLCKMLETCPEQHPWSLVQARVSMAEGAEVAQQSGVSAGQAGKEMGEDWGVKMPSDLGERNQDTSLDFL